MAKNVSVLTCTECGWSTTRWVGRCAQCQAWGSLTEAARPAAGVPVALAPSVAATRIADVPAETARAVPTGIGELDRVLGDGLVPGSVVLLGGEPGVGKSTLLLEVAARWAAGGPGRPGRPTLYVTAEESAAQVRRRADRTASAPGGGLPELLYLAAESDLGVILGHVEAIAPSLLVLDSVQTVAVADAAGGGRVAGAAGGVAQVREVTNALVRVAKRRNLTVLIVGHVTKDGSLAGPRALEHLVDVVLGFEGDRHAALRLVRATKNRFGPADEVGCFEMTETGIREVADPSGAFTTSGDTPASGTCTTVTLEGRRPLVAEVQALVVPSSLTSPRRVATGLDAGRLTLTLAVLQRHARLKLHHRDVYASTVGGGRVVEPGADLAIALAVASAARDHEPPGRLVALGEVGLSGDLRRVPGVQRRLAEAARLGVRHALVPAGSEVARLPGLRVHEVATLAEAVALTLGGGGARGENGAEVVPLAGAGRRQPTRLA